MLMTTNRITEPFGTFKVRGFQNLIIGLTRRLPSNWIGRRLLVLLRKPVVKSRTDPLDLVVLGQKMRLYAANNACEKRLIFSPQRFDPEELQYLDEILKPPFTFVDIGANVGAYSVFAGRRADPSCRLLAFEPHPEVRERLQYNLRANDVHAVEIFDIALSDQEGTIAFNAHTGNIGQSTILSADDPETRQTLSVATRPLLSVLNDAGVTRIDVLKIDIEGAEETVLHPFFENAPETLRPRTILLEPNSADWSFDLTAYLQVLDYNKILDTGRNHIYRLP